MARHRVYYAATAALIVAAHQRLPIRAVADDATKRSCIGDYGTFPQNGLLK